MKDLTALLKDITSQSINDSDALQILKQIKKDQALKIKYPVKINYAFNDSILRNHTLGGAHVMMGVTHLSLMINYLINNSSGDEMSLQFEKFNLIEPFILKEGETGSIEVQTEKETISTICRIGEQKPPFMASSGKFNFQTDIVKAAIDPNIFSIVQTNKTINGQALYEKQLKVDVVYGKGLQSVTSYIISEDNHQGVINLDDEIVSELNDYYLHPSVLDSAFLIATADLEPGYVPLFIKKIVVFKGAKNATRYYCKTSVQKYNNEIQIMDFDIYNDTEIVISCWGFTSKKVSVREDSKADFTKSELSGNDVMISKVSKDPIMTSTINTEITDLTPSNVNRQKNDFSEAELLDMIQEFIVTKIGLATGLDLDLDQILEKNFMEIGADSKNLIGISKILEDELKIELYPTLFFEYQNVKELSEYFLEEYRSGFQEYFNLMSRVSDETRVVQNQEHSIIKEKIIESSIKNENIPPSIYKSTKENDFFQYNGRDYKTSDIAIIGMSAKLPKSDTLDEFWDAVSKGESLTGEIPVSHFDYRPWYDVNCSMEERKINCKWGGFLNNIDKFDAGFFNISPHEAELMDPQLRILLEEMYATTEDAGIINKLRKTKTGVFVGICSHDYSDNAKAVGKIIHPYDGTGNSMTMFPNRASFFFNISGPSYPIDTACSSSLVALYSACRAIQAGDCEMAFVAGTNLLLSPDHYVYFSKLGVLSKKGLTTTFDDQADGYVPGESVSVMLLKPLKRAIEDGDNIHAVIKGVATGHGGYTNTITAPSPNKEAEVIKSAWDDAGIDPKTVSYIEAHGTGTKLGDPIEMDGLKIAFKEHTTAESFCYVGSAKANIGHTEGSAGISGMLKVVMSMKNKTIPPLANFTKLNSFIQLDKTALKINKEALPWNPIAGVRRAGVSSFGFGGSYAHAVLEDFEFEKIHEPVADKVVILISAQNKNSLLNNVNQLIGYFNVNNIDQRQLTAIAYTLQIGRESMPHRIAFTAVSAEQVIEKLTTFIEKGKGVYQNELSKNESPIITNTDVDDIAYIDQLLRTGKNDKLLKLWLAGTTVAWEKLYSSRPKILSLPTYGFDRKRHWYDLPQGIEMQAGSKSVLNSLHPLLDENESSLKKISFSKMFSNREFYLRDHIINNVSILPGVAILEMFRAAAALASESSVHKLTNIIWKSPLKVDTPLKVIEVEINSIDDSTISLKLQSNNNNIVEIHAIGNVVLDYSFNLKENKRFNVQEILDRTDLVNKKEELYSKFANAGLCLGESMQGVLELRGNDKEAISIIKLPKLDGLKFSEFKLHPTLLDSALHSVIGINQQNDQFIGLPFSMESVEIKGELTKNMYSYVQLAKNSRPSEVHRSFNIFLLNEEGECVVEITKFTVVNFSLDTPKVTEEVVESNLQYFVPTWKLSPITSREFTLPDNKLYFCGDPLFWKASKELNYDIIDSNADNIKNWNQDKAICLFNLLPTESEKTNAISYYLNWTSRIRRILQEKPKGKINIMFTSINESQRTLNNELLELFTGFFNSLKLEEPRIQFKAVTINESDSKTYIKILLQELFENGDMVLYDKNQRLTPSWNTSVVSEQITIGIQAGKIYLVTGGTGAIGRTIINHLLEKNAKVIVVGRKDVSAEDLDSLYSSVKEGLLDYRKCDISSDEDVQNLGKGLEGFEISGIIHCAGSNYDKPFNQLSVEEELMVLTPKIKGFELLDNAFKSQPLDFIVLFSSLAAVVGNVGQTVYSAANAYLNVKATNRNKLVEQGKRYGHTISINWPYWKDGGMKISQTGEQLLFNLLGQKALDNIDGISAFDDLLKSVHHQVVVATGNTVKLEAILNRTHKFGVEANEKVEKTIVYDKKQEVGELTLQLKRIIADILKIEIEEIDDEMEFADLGLDSVVGMQLIEIMLKTFGNKLSPTILFDYPTIKAIGEYLVDNDIQFENISMPAIEVSKSNKEKVNTQIIKGYNVKNDKFFKEMKKIIFNGPNGDIEVFIKGTGNPILFLSGFGMSAKIWEKQLQLFSENNQCLFVQLPLFVSTTQKISFFGIAEQIKSGLEQHGYSEVNVIGWSMGGMIAQILTGKYPKLFKKQVLVNSSANIKGANIWSEESNLLNFRKDLEDLHVSDGNFLPIREYALELVQNSQILDTKGKIAYGKAFLDFDNSNQLDEIKLPTLITGSKYDSMIPMEENLNLYQNIDNADFLSFTHSGHFPFITESEHFNAKILDFINN